MANRIMNTQLSWLPAEDWQKIKRLGIGGSLGGKKEELGKSWRGTRKGNKVNMFIVYYKHV